MDQELLDRIAKLIYPYLKTKHKDTQAHEIAKHILEELDKQPPTWYTHG
jgi:hypothetical protein